MGRLELVSGSEINLGAQRGRRVCDPHHHQLLLGSALEMPSVLLYLLVGTLRKCQADASEFVTICHPMTSGHHLFTRALPWAPSSGLHRSWKIHEIEFPALFLVLLLHQEPTFENIRSLSKGNYAAACFNPEQPPTPLTYSLSPYLQHWQDTHTALEVNLTDWLLTGCFSYSTRTWDDGETVYCALQLFRNSSGFIFSSSSPPP